MLTPDPTDLFHHLPLPGVRWGDGPAAVPEGNRVFGLTFSLDGLPGTLHAWPDGVHVTRLLTRGGARHVCRLHLSTLPGGSRLALLEDVDHYHKDPLTGLDDRRALLLDCAESCPGGTLALLDIDHFKDVNDALGHSAGDELLCVLAGLLSTAARSWRARAYRLGGDEFVLCAPLRLDAEHLALLQHHFQRAGLRQGLGPGAFSYGLAHAPHDGHSLDELLRHADAQLSRSKRRRGGLVAQLGQPQPAPPPGRGGPDSATSGSVPVSS